jgi:hypothetical protein
MNFLAPWLLREMGHRICRKYVCATYSAAGVNGSEYSADPIDVIAQVQSRKVKLSYAYVYIFAICLSTVDLYVLIYVCKYVH